MTASTSKVDVAPAEDEQIQQQLQDVASRLVEHYREHQPTVSEQQVHTAMRHAADRLADAPVRGFLPILVERAVRRALDT